MHLDYRSHYGDNYIGGYEDLLLRYT